MMSDDHALKAISAYDDVHIKTPNIDRIAKGYPLRKIGEPLIAKGDISPQHIEQSKEFGQAMAAGLSLGIF